MFELLAYLYNCIPYVHIGLKILLYIVPLLAKLNFECVPINLFLPQYDFAKSTVGLNELLRNTGGQSPFLNVKVKCLLFSSLTLILQLLNHISMRFNGYLVPMTL